jgi:hypothetical protein
MKKARELAKTPRTSGWLRLFLPLFARALWAIKLTLLFSAPVTFAVFYSVGDVPTSFLTGLVTIDSLLIAVIGFVATVVLRIIGIEEIRNKLGETAEDKGIMGIASQLGLAGPYAVPILFAMIAVLPYFVAAVLSLVGMLMPHAIAVYFGALALWLTLSAFLGVLSLTWHLTNRVWDTKVQNIQKLIKLLRKRGWFRSMTEG